MKYFPIFFNLEGRRVLIVGGGEQALQKVRLLRKTPAHIAVVGQSMDPELLAYGDDRIALIARRFEPADLNGAALVFVATGDPARDEEVATAARARDIPVNVVDRPAESTFIMPAIVDRDPVTVAIGAEGAAPVLARQLKSRIESWLPANFGRLAVLGQGLRPRIKAAVPSFPQRRQVWERLFSGPFRSHALAGEENQALREAEREIAAAQADTPSVGHVTLIGCGPGDPDLLTLKAQQRLQDADVLVIDRLVNPAILEYARRDARRIDAGKSPGDVSISQDDINRTLIREARAGHRVARLKGGDAFVFGRAAEEMTSLRAAGIQVEVIPGITAAHACAASVGLPLTLRSKVRQFSIVTGSTADGPVDLDWEALAGPGQAFAIYMGVRNAPAFRERLIGSGASPRTAVVIVENGTLPDERAILTTLEDLPAAIVHKGIAGPAILFVGLDWRDSELSRPQKVEVFTASRPLRAPSHERRPTPSEIAMATHWVAG